jgi:hypothetical protein
MQNQQRRINASPIEVQMILRDHCPEIDLVGQALIKFKIEQPGTRVMCTAGALWLTQQGDPLDHFLEAGQSFSLDRHGVILVQGLPSGKALILPRSGEKIDDGGCSQSPANKLSLNWR